MQRNGTIVYGHDFSNSELEFIAANYKILVCDLPLNQNKYIDFGGQMAYLRSLNSQILIFGYKMLVGVYDIEDDFATINAHEDWFLHDANNNRLMNSGFYMLDVGNVGYQQHLVQYFTQKFNAYPAYSGVLLDNVWDTMYDNRVSPGKIASWHSDTNNALKALMDALTPLGKMVIVNTEAGWLYGHVNFDYVGITNGMQLENFAHSNSGPNFGENTIACLSTVTGMGKICLAEAQGPDTSSADFCYNAFLMGVNGVHAYFGFNVGWQYANNTFVSPMSIDAGEPLQTRQINSQNGTYTRVFTKGNAYLDPSGNIGIWTPLEVAKTYKLDISVNPSGAGSYVVNPSQPAEGYLENTWVNVVVTVNQGFTFDGWELDGILTRTPGLSNDFYMNSDHVLKLFFLVEQTPPPPPPPIEKGVVRGFFVISGGSGYTTPAIVISGGGGTGASATARVSNGVILNVVRISGGSGYWEIPTVTVRDPSPRASGALVLADLPDPANPPPPPPPPPKSGVAAIGGYEFGGYEKMLPPSMVKLLWKLREKYIRQEVHKKLHPLI